MIHRTRIRNSRRISQKITARILLKIAATIHHRMKATTITTITTVTAAITAVTTAVKTVITNNGGILPLTYFDI